VDSSAAVGFSGGKKTAEALVPSPLCAPKYYRQNSQKWRAGVRATRIANRCVRHRERAPMRP
jgi:hypothetical protein